MTVTNISHFVPINKQLRNNVKKSFKISSKEGRDKIRHMSDKFWDTMTVCKVFHCGPQCAEYTGVH